MPIFEVLEMMFDLSRTTANDLFHYWLPIFRDLLPSSLLEEWNKMLFYQTVDEIYFVLHATLLPLNPILQSQIWSFVKKGLRRQGGQGKQGGLL